MNTPGEKTSPVLDVGLLLVVLSLAFTGCGPDEVENGIFVVLDLDSETREYALTERPIDTLTDVPTMDGSLVEFRAGGDLVATSEEPQTESEWRNALLVEGSTTPAVEYEENGKVVVPLGFHTTVLFTLAHHVEQSAEYFDSIGLTESEKVGRIPLYYRPSLDTGLLPVPVPIFTDNAAYAFTLDAFIIPPRLLLNDLPLAANRGVIVHEYSHAVFNRIVHEDRRAPSYLVEDWPQVAVNEMLSLDEGVADIFGALQTREANFIEPSLSSGIALDRDLDETRFYSQSLLDVAESQDEIDYDPYRIGSVVASTIWSLRDELGEDRLGSLVLDSLRAIADPDENFRLTDFVNAFVALVPESSREFACNRFLQRFTAVSAAITCEGSQP